MGVSTSLPYDLEEEIPFSPTLHWQLFHGRKKVRSEFALQVTLPSHALPRCLCQDDDPSNAKEQVAIYKFLKSQSLSISIPQRGIQRIRTMKFVIFVSLP
jgi:hypothetical protein